MQLKFSHVDILVSDLNVAVDYYRRALGCIASEKLVWQRDDFHVEFVVMFKDDERFFFVRPISGELKEMLDAKGDGTIYRLCFTTPNVVQSHRELVSNGVQPVDERGNSVDELNLESPGQTNIVWLPKVIGGLSIEILEEAPFEKKMANLRENAS